jgi:hypothetical protein
VATDGGGSTRIPAAANGMVGLKQSNGVIPHSQVADLFGNYTYVTPMTRTVMDTALMLQAMAGPHPSDPWSIGTVPQDYVAGGQPGRRPQGQAHPAQPDARQSLRVEGRGGRPTSGAGEARGGRRRAGRADGDLPDMEPIWKVINHTTWRARFGRHDPARRQPHDARRWCARSAMAEQWSGTDYQKAMFQRADLFRMVQKWLDGADYLVTPTLSRTALPIEQDLFEPINIDGIESASSAQLVPLHHAVQHHRPSRDHGVLRLWRRRPADRPAESSAASATRPRSCAPRRSTRRASPGSSDGPTSEAFSSGPRASGSLRGKRGPEARGPEDSEGAPLSAEEIQARVLHRDGLILVIGQAGGPSR